MCGITGWIAFGRELADSAPIVRAMTETMACRGPDDEGIWCEGPAALGHRRLAVIDPPGGAQPMTVDTPGGRVTIVYSGETYNFTELRAELARAGVRFRTGSDTEVVLQAYLHWGESRMAQRLNGMYAFAVWDERVRRLVLVRDRLGVKPLFYYRTQDGVLFGSEPKAVLANPLARPVLDADGLRELLAFTKTPRQAVWAGMREVEPGTLITVDATGVREHTYWHLASRPHQDSPAETVEQVRGLLEDTVRRQLVADVPRCVLLSGGLDSSAITALAHEQLAPLGEKVRTFAVDFVGHEEQFRADDIRGTPDSPYVRQMVEHLGTEHTTIELDPAGLADPELRRKVVLARDLPTGMGDMDTSLYLLFAEIRKHSTVALSGEAADEVFGGYRHFHDPAIQQMAAFSWVANGQGPVNTTGSLLVPELAATLDVAGYRRQRYAEALRRVEPLDEDSETDHRLRVMFHQHLTQFVRMLLDRKDRLSMAVGLEVRVPFCDHRLVEYVYNVPWELKSFDGREKSLLRSAVRHLLPETVALRKKSPYPATKDPAYVRATLVQGADLLARQNHEVFDLISRDWLSEVVRREPDHLGPADRHGLERALDLEVWLDAYRPLLRLG